MDSFSDLLKPQNSGKSNGTSGQGTTPSSRGGTPANDSFASLMGSSSSSAAKKKAMAQMSLQERQKLQQEQKKQQDASWAGLDLLGGGMEPPRPEQQQEQPRQQQQQQSQGGGGQDLDDLFDVFNKPPPPKETPKVESPPPPPQESHSASRASTPSRSSTPSTSASTTGSRLPKNDPRDGPIAELVDMGFEPEQAREALANTDDGLNVEQAITYIMRKASQNAKRTTLEEQEQLERQQHKQEGLAGLKDTDVGKMASDFSAAFISTAGKFWNQGRKNVAKAIENYHHSGVHDDGTPAWMRDANRYRNQSPSAEPRSRADATPEASALDMPAPERPSARSKERAKYMDDDYRPRSEHRAERERAPRRQNEDPIRKTQTPEPRSNSSSSSNSGLGGLFSSFAGSASQASRRFKNDDDAMMPSSRRRPAAASSSSSSSRRPTPVASKPATPEPPRPKPTPVRNQPSISSTSMDMVNEGRQSGTDAYKRGDYIAAADAFGRALQSVPEGHLLRTVLLSNRAACYLLSGDPKAALMDAEAGVQLIGDSYGQGEEAEPGKNLKDIWAKLVTKRAESNEQLEKHQQALEAWNLLMHNGYSNKQAMEGRRRCQNAIEPKRQAAPKKPAAKKPSAAPQSKSGQEAVSRVRGVGQRAEKQEAEKFALHDQVEQRIAAWRHGKEDNLRALLASLDTILWDELGWKNVSMAELVMPKKVKIAYMKAVAKTHPDKITPQTPVEQQMIANAVFITLNTAWDGFKAENGLS